MGMNPLSDKWASGAVTLGVWCSLPSSVTAEIAARTGPDFVTVDMQHGLIGYDTALTMLQAIDTTEVPSVVRVPWNDPAIIGKVLDSGAMTVVVPMTNTAQDVRDAVAACRYATEGIRSFGPTRAGYRYGPEYFGSANEDVVIMPMIETVEALSNIDEIAAVPGVGGLFFGPFDFSVSAGLPPGNNDGNPKFDEAIERVTGVCKARSLVAGTLANPDLGALRVKQGFRFVAVTMDAIGLGAALGADLAKVRSELA